MPVYSWKGLNSAGKAVTGTRDADGPKALRQALRKDGVFITEHREVLAGGSRRRRAPRQRLGRDVSVLKREIDFKAMLERVQPQEVAAFTRQLATLLKAGIPLAEALGALAEQADNKKLEVVLAEIRQKVNEGSSLADTLAAHPTHLPGALHQHGPLGRGGRQPRRGAVAAGRLPRRAARAAVQGLGRADLPDHHGGAGHAGHGRADGGGRPQDHLDLRGHGQDAPLEHAAADLPGRPDRQLLVGADHRSSALSYWLYRRWSRKPKGRARRRPGQAEAAAHRAAGALRRRGPVRPHAGHHAGRGRAGAGGAGDHQEGPQQHRAGEGGRRGARRHPRGRVDRHDRSSARASSRR